MGTWGTGPFDNDLAYDWLADLEKRGFREVKRVLKLYEKLPAYGHGKQGKLRRSGMPVERSYDDDILVMCAGEIVVWFADQRPSDPEIIDVNFKDWLDKQRTPKKLPITQSLWCARTVVKNSWLKDSWKESVNDSLETLQTGLMAQMIERGRVPERLVQEHNERVKEFAAKPKSKLAAEKEKRRKTAEEWFAKAKDLVRRLEAAANSSA